jgi:hypothetical protein
MQKLTITIALTVIALALGTTTITTTMQIQPAYSQASHCTEGFPSRCVTAGQDPSVTLCFNPFDCDPSGPIGGDNPHQDAGRLISACHRGELAPECTVRQLP